MIANLFNLTPADLLVVLIIVALLFGAKELPELGRKVGEKLQRKLPKVEHEGLPPVSWWEITFLALLIACVIAVLISSR